jgi:metal-responsive CopG/Arc/MetJ family transcriptional regulator
MKTADDKHSKETVTGQLVHMRFDPQLLKRLDDFRFRHRFESRSEAARWLMKYTLDQTGVTQVGREGLSDGKETRKQRGQHL